MLKRKEIVKCQKMLDYLEVYEELILMQTEFISKSVTATNKTSRNGYRKLAEDTNKLLVNIATGALDDKAIRS